MQPADNAVTVMTAGGAGNTEKQKPLPQPSSVETQNKQPAFELQGKPPGFAVGNQGLEIEASHSHDDADDNEEIRQDELVSDPLAFHSRHTYSDDGAAAPKPAPLVEDSHSSNQSAEMVWLIVCFLGIMASFVCYGLLLEYTTSGGRQLHELSFLFVTSALYSLTAAAGRYVRDETPTTIPPARFAVLGLTSMGSTFCSVRSLR